MLESWVTTLWSFFSPGNDSGVSYKGVFLKLSNYFKSSAYKGGNFKNIFLLICWEFHITYFNHIDLLAPSRSTPTFLTSYPKLHVFFSLWPIESNSCCPYTPELWTSSSGDTIPWLSHPSEDPTICSCSIRGGSSWTLSPSTGEYQLTWSRASLVRATTGASWLWAQQSCYSQKTLSHSIPPWSLLALRRVYAWCRLFRQGWERLWKQS